MDRRGPFSLQGLLKFAIAQSDTNNTTTYQEMDEDRKHFLENAFKSMTVDVMEELRQAIGVLENSTSTDEEKCNALHIIRDYIDNVDFANSFVKLGGTNILKTCLQSDNVLVQTASINIIAEMSQNNPFCQQHFLENGFLVLLLQHVNKDEELSASSLYSISGIVRSFEPGLAELIKLGGLKAIMNCLDTSFSRVFIKATFLISTLSAEYAIVRDEFVLLGAFDKLSNCLEIVTDFDIKTEAILRAMAELALSLQFQIDGDMKKLLIEKLRQIVDKNQNLPQSEEIVSYANNLLDKFTS